MTFFDMIGFVAGFILVYRAGQHIEAMSARSNHFVRAAYYMLTVGGAALVMTPIAGDVAWMSPLGAALAVCGAALLLAFDRRRIDGEAETMHHGRTR